MTAGYDISGWWLVVIGAVAVLVLLLVVISVVNRIMRTRAAFTRQLEERTTLLEKSEEKYRLIVDTALDAVVTMDEHALITDWNPQAEKIFGWTRAEALGLRMSETIIPLRYREAHEAGLTRFLETGAGPVLNRRIEITAIRQDGTEFPVELAISPARVGQQWTFSAFLRDLTERKNAAAALRAEQQRLTQILEAVPVGIFVADREGHFVFGNEAARRILGQGVFPDLPLSALAEKYHVYAAGTDELYPTERMPIARALHGERVSADDLEIRRDGRTISLSVQAAPLFDDAGNIVAGVAVFEDTTDRKILDAQLRQALKMEAVGQLAGGVAHDFNNLLTVILSYSSMLEEGLDPSDPIGRDLREITAAAERAAGLTRQLLAFSRKQVLQPQVIDVNAVITNVETLLRRLIGVDITVEIDLQSGIPPVNADPGQLEQVLMNLAVNARDAMPDGGVLTIRTAGDGSVRHGAPDDEEYDRRTYVALSVSDTGSGMTSDVRERVFDPFFTTKRPGEGTGLGLSTVYGIVKQSGGDIRVRSEPGHGTAFDIYLPCADAPTRTATTPSTPASSTRAQRGSETILVVEDDPSLRTLAAGILKRYGYTVIPAASGPEALALFADSGTVIDAVLADVIMPGMNGREVIERLLAARPGLPYLFMSGYTDDEVLRRGVLHGDSPFLQKPFTADQLARKIRDVLDGPPRPSPSG